MEKKLALTYVGNSQTTKRARTQLTEIDYVHPCKSLQFVLLPPEIIALPHAMETINRLAMTPQEALVEAVMRNQACDLHHVLQRFRCESSDTFVVAAGFGNQVAMRLLRDEIEYRDELEVLATAAAAAAKNGRLNAANYLLGEFEHSFQEPVDERNAYYRVDDATWVVMDEAAAEGHLDVVKLGVAHALESKYVALSPCGSDALYCAVCGGHADVVRYLLGQNLFGWKLDAALEKAMENDDKVIVKMLYEAYPVYADGQNLFVRMARDARKDAVEYLYDTIHPSTSLVGEAFVDAARCYYTDTAEFLLTTGRVPTDAFDKAVSNAVSSGRISLLRTLTSKKRASPQVLITAATLGQFPIVKCLLNVQRQSVNALVDAHNMTREPSVRALLRETLEHE
ncbi:hypothetical protein PHYSODRAFT_327530 [Phytophthora sojae]|uniref:Ankyrin repeat-containing domain n=1 Tax=Phytophthora sojae (strain P6497) TaxID=1094619 RepID=G4Z286_PHYSP|nr:hypothetical protein PHYSODRAFT_297869 [Phytophthora sojae]XP_009521947.1 hypothetical protein PHYSODRAFT_327530 [Phytophthora sojae]EGZ19227.1 hypothetical protein PHYSODRAFT_297869 [Phytophthora sojae]EGZ19230.1 hypothetical protein PHYSODRAFT_327530 [Phytophthora sojae]|eukprot:XP_009521944.1 hypothetical protein PHYSODRAFT_297869 [Phytophthora sojae]